MENKINVIKEYRNITGSGLSEAIQAINNFINGDKSEAITINLAMKKASNHKPIDKQEKNRKQIRYDLQSINNTLQELIDDTSDNFDYIDPESLDSIIYFAQNIKRLINNMEC